MGAAKRSGTFEQRKAMAQRRNTALTNAIMQSGSTNLRGALEAKGAKRLATELVQDQLLKQG